MIDQLVKWYGTPGSWMGSHKHTDLVIMGASAENIVMVAQAIASGQSAGIITAGTRTHAIAPHPFHEPASHARFYAAIGAPVPQRSEAEMWNDRANLLFELGWKKESVECCLRSLAQNSEAASPWVNLGRYFMDPTVADFPLATACLKQALEIDPNRPKALANLGAVHFAQGLFPESLAFCERALQYDPNDFHANYYLVGAIVELRNTFPKNECRQQLQRALLHARTAQRIGHPEAARVVEQTIQWLESVLGIRPGNDD